MLEKDLEAIHQIYCREYYNFIRRIDTVMTDQKFKDRLKKMFFITYVTDTKDFAYISIREFNEKLKCNCVDPKKPCKSKEAYSTLKTNMYQIPSNIGYSQVEAILPDKKRKHDDGECSH